MVAWAKAGLLVDIVAAAHASDAELATYCKGVGGVLPGMTGSAVGSRGSMVCC